MRVCVGGGGKESVTIAPKSLMLLIYHNVTNTTKYEHMQIHVNK